MPLSTDNQDYGKSDKKSDPSNKEQSEKAEKNTGDENSLTSDNLKGKKVDADPEKESDRPSDV
jgi:hypothetical protein